MVKNDGENFWAMCRRLSEGLIGMKTVGVLTEEVGRSQIGEDYGGLVRWLWRRGCAVWMFWLASYRVDVYEWLRNFIATHKARGPTMTMSGPEWDNKEEMTMET